MGNEESLSWRCFTTFMASYLQVSKSMGASQQWSHADCKQGQDRWRFRKIFIG